VASKNCGIVNYQEQTGAFAALGSAAAFVEEQPGVNTQGTTLEAARANLKEAVTLVLDANRVMAEESIEGADVIRETFVLPAT
jgi:predicted RNase H-like HicB family nuclease